MTKVLFPHQVKPFIIFQKHQARAGIRATRKFRQKHKVYGGVDTLVRKE